MLHCSSKLALASLVLLPALPSAAQEELAGPRIAIQPRLVSARSAITAPSLRVDVRKVLVPVTVTDGNGAPVSRLPKQSFRILENGVEQDISWFSTEDTPISLGIIFDASRSMEDKIDQSRAAVSSLNRSLVAGDEYFLMEFSDRPRLLTPFTKDFSSIERRLIDIQSQNWTALLDAVYLSMRQMGHARNTRKVLLILSDGADNSSRYTESEMRSAVREADVSIYSIAIVGKGLLSRHLRLLRQLSEETGGMMVQVQKMSEIHAAVDRINDAIRNQYLLGFTPRNNTPDGMFRKISVKLDQPAGAPRLHASWRNGYYAP